MIEVLNLALPYFGLIFIGFACGKFQRLPEIGLAWMNFFLLYVSLPALFFRILAKTPFEQLSNLPFVIATEKPTRRDGLAYYRAVVKHFGIPLRQYERVVSRIACL